MPTLSEDRIADLLEPYLGGLQALAENSGVLAGSALYSRLSVYLDVLVRWNTRTNLTAIRVPEEIVQRHFGESLFAGIELAKRLGQGAGVLDFGSGAGFPGLPIALLLPEFRVTLAESQGKKAAFLREAVRVTGASAEVWAGRVEGIEADRRFDAVMLRAVDDVAEMRSLAADRVRARGFLVELRTGKSEGPGECVPLPRLKMGFVCFTEL